MGRGELPPGYKERRDAHKELMRRSASELATQAENGSPLQNALHAYANGDGRKNIEHLLIPTMMSWAEFTYMIKANAYGPQRT